MIYSQDYTFWGKENGAQSRYRILEGSKIGDHKLENSLKDILEYFDCWFDTDIQQNLLCNSREESFSNWVEDPLTVVQYQTVKSNWFEFEMDSLACYPLGKFIRVWRIWSSVIGLWEKPWELMSTESICSNRRHFLEETVCKSKKADLKRNDTSKF